VPELRAILARLDATSLVSLVDETRTMLTLTAVVRLREPVPVTGAEITLSSSDDSLTIPAAITIDAGAHAARFNVSTSYAGKPKSVFISATYEDAWAQGRLFIPSAPASICNIHVCPE
jgi:hypothetical protein